nr:DpnII family type II restriction endonuclease [Helicobacter pylori]
MILFLESLKTSNRTLDFFTDWQKCLKNKNEISIALKPLEFLLGKDTKELKNCIKSLFKEYPKAFNVLNILIAVRDKDDIVHDANGNFYPYILILKMMKKSMSLFVKRGWSKFFVTETLKI